MLARVRACSLSDRQRGCVRVCFMEKGRGRERNRREREKEREGEREKEREEERERGRERDVEYVQNFLFLKGMMGALAPFGYLVKNNVHFIHSYPCLASGRGTMVDDSPRHYKAVGLNPAPA
jgi:hypothetical protein